ncbi:hypothetical protein MBLNU457_4104t1 [Dothideomycetes sp. NU457]
MASDSSAASSGARVPAWKKIGLRLKNASETLPEVKATSTKQTNGTQVNEQPHDDRAASSNQPLSLSKPTTLAIRSPEGKAQSHDGAKKSKKRKASEADDASTALSSTEGPESRSTEVNAKQPKESKEDRKITSAERSSKRRKSVSFAADTKSEDGNSVTTTPVNQEIQDLAIEKKASKKDKKAKAAQSATGSTSDDSKVASAKAKPRDIAKAGYLEYLDQFHNDRENWKFNKSKQNDLIKNVFNIYRIPPDYDGALSAYIEGLQGEGARKRLRDQAGRLITQLKNSTQKELPDDVSVQDMETREARAIAYKLAEDREIERMRSLGLLNDKSEETVHETARRRRAQDSRATEILLLHALAFELGKSPDDYVTKASGPQVPTPPNSQSTSDTNTIAREKRRKRKSRTADISSDESSSDSSDDSDSDEEKPARKQTKKIKLDKTSAASDDESSSSSDDSDEDSSSDDSSNSDSDSNSASESDSSSSQSDSDDSGSSSEEDSEADESSGEEENSKAKKAKPVAFEKEFLDKAFGEKRKRRRRF